jgi:predicted nucleic acid-binding protein
MKIFVDTNLFVYAIDALSPFHPAAVAFLRRVEADDFQAHCSFQVLAEFYSAVTKRVRRPLPPRQAAREVRRLIEAESLVKLVVDDVVVRLTTELAQRYDLRGVAIFDAQIVGTMLSHEIEHLYTVNTDDFSRFTEIRVVNPVARVPGP